MAYGKIFICCLFIFFVENINSEINAHRVKRLIGGENVAPNEIPYQASLRIGVKTHICGGAIISNKHILSAAHCVCGLIDEPYDDLTVMTGSIDLKEGGQIHKVENIYCHPDYAYQGTSINDLVIIEVKDNIIRNSSQSPIALPTTNITTDTEGIFSGWGRTNVEVDAPSRYLKKLERHILKSETCKKYYNNPIMSHNICGYVKEGYSLCKGDSGGPLVQNGVLIGIFSWTKPCALGYPDVYSNVYYFMDFISSIISNTVQYYDDPYLTEPKSNSVYHKLL